MRVTKFRAWDVEKSEMVYNGAFQFEQFPQPSVLSIPDVRQRIFPFEGIESGEMITSDPLNGWHIMQYTGLKDKNSLEVWEGDIVRAAFMHHGKPSELIFTAKIVYNEHIGAYQLSYPNIENVFVSDQIYFRYQIEVIGNIYANPDHFNTLPA